MTPLSVPREHAELALAEHPDNTRHAQNAERVAALLDVRTQVTEQFFVAEGERIARLCHRMAERFAHGGRLIAIGDTPAARSDVRHVTVEFVHPVIVGKRALPALGITVEPGSLAGQTDLLVQSEDIVIAFGDDERHGTPSHEIAADFMTAVRVARNRGAFTIAFAQIGAEWTFAPPTDDPFVRQESVETFYHILWELVHVFFEHRGLLDIGNDDTPVHDAGASSFLYPFLARQENDLEAVVADVRQSVITKARDVTALRIAMMDRSTDSLLKAAELLRSAFTKGRAAIVFGNGGSATDAMDAAADLRFPPARMRSYRTLDLTEDTAVLTAIANDVGTDGIFSRQIIAYGQPGDVAIAFSTSGNSRNVIQALEEARKRGLLSIALAGYDGGQILADNLADVVIVAPSQYTPRVQEAQATAWHIIRALLG